MLAMYLFGTHVGLKQQESHYFLVLFFLLSIILLPLPNVLKRVLAFSGLFLQLFVYAVNASTWMFITSTVSIELLSEYWSGASNTIKIPLIGMILLLSYLFSKTLLSFSAMQKPHHKLRYLGFFLLFGIGVYLSKGFFIKTSYFEDELITDFFNFPNTAPWKEQAHLFNENALEEEQYQPSAQHKKFNIILIQAESLNHNMVTFQNDGLTPKTESLKTIFKDSQTRFMRSHAQETVASLSGTLSSKIYPASLIPNQLSLIDVLNKNGYETHLLYSKSLGHILRPLYQRKFKRADKTDFDYQIPALIHDKNFETNKSHFLYFYLMSSHVTSNELHLPAKYYPHGAEHFYEHLSLFNNTHNEEARQILINSYKNKIDHLDHAIYEIMMTLKEKGLLENALVLITGDHGEANGENNTFGHGGQNINEISIKVPLLILNNTGQPFQLIKQSFSQLDIAPTLTDFLAIPTPKSWQGLSGLQNKYDYSYHRFGLRPKSKSIQCFGKMYVDTNLRKFVYCSNKEKPNSIQLFDLVGNEEKDIWPQLPAKEREFILNEMTADYQEKFAVKRAEIHDVK